MKVFISGWSLQSLKWANPRGFFYLIYPLYNIPTSPSLCLFPMSLLIHLFGIFNYFKIKSISKQNIFMHNLEHCITSFLLPYHKTYITRLFTQSHIQQIVLIFKYAQGASLVSHFRENTDMSSSYAIHYMTTIVTSTIEVPQMLWDHITFSSDLNLGKRKWEKNLSDKSSLRVIVKMNAWKALSLESHT